MFKRSCKNQKTEIVQSFKIISNAKRINARLDPKIEILKYIILEVFIDYFFSRKYFVKTYKANKIYFKKIFRLTFERGLNHKLGIKKALKSFIDSSFLRNNFYYLIEAKCLSYSF